MLKKYYFVIVLIIAATSCIDDKQEHTYRKCNSLLSNCGGSPNGEYCLLGYKWGGGNPFSNVGVEANGPKISGNTVTFGFYNEGEIIHTHSQNNIPTLSFNQITVCEAQTQIRVAFRAWSSVANIEFQEASSVEVADIRFAIANIKQGGVGFPAFTDDICSSVAGQVVLNTNRNTCDAFYNLAIHEIGHALGLGHVNSNNIMNPNYDQTSTELENGDVLGIQSIYGQK